MAAGAVNLALALARGAPSPGLGTVATAATVGFFGYGVSLVLFVPGLLNIATCMTSITNMSMRRKRRLVSLIATGTGTRGFFTSIRTIRTCITATSTSTRERTKRPVPGRSK